MHFQKNHHFTKPFVYAIVEKKEVLPMKFKVTIICLLTAILIVCSFTSFRLIQEAEKQTKYNEITSLFALKAWQTNDNVEEMYRQSLFDGYYNEWLQIGGQS